MKEDASDDGQGNSIDLLIDVQGKDIRHAADVVDDGHQARFQVIAVDIILTAEAADELLRMEFVWIDCGINQTFHQVLHDMVTAQFHIQNRFALIDTFLGYLSTFPIGFIDGRSHSLNQRLLKGA